jgi:hypothetical protein
MTQLWKRPTCGTVVQDIASVYQPHSGLLPPHPPKTPITAVVVIFHTGSKMSALLLRLATDATVRGMTTRDGLQVFSVYDFVNLVCRKNDTYS